MIMAKYFGRRNVGTSDLIMSNRILNHCAGSRSAGNRSSCLRVVRRRQLLRNRRGKEDRTFRFVRERSLAPKYQLEDERRADDRDRSIESSDQRESSIPAVRNTPSDQVQESYRLHLRRLSPCSNVSRRSQSSMRWEDVPASFSSPSARYKRTLRSTIERFANASFAPVAQSVSISIGSESIDVAKIITLPGGK